jgi:GTP-binding protein Era
VKRAGTVALVGRPNAGKSTLMNLLLGEKVAIVSDKPQTTRQRLVGILSGERGQMVFHDTPGIHRPLHRLNRQMVRHALDALGDADVVCLLADASEAFGAGDAYLLDLVGKTREPRILALNKIDRVKKPALLPAIARYGASGVFSEIVPISALTGDGKDDLLEVLWNALPEGEPIYDPELLTIHPERFLVAERIREKVLAETREEVPFATAVIVERWEEAEDDEGGGGGLPEGEGRGEAKRLGLVRIHASILVERPGQKKIVVGRQGQMIRAIGTAARLDLEQFLGRRVFLDLHVRLEPNWREDRVILAQLDRDVDLSGG